MKLQNYFIFTIVIAIFHTHSLDAMRALTRGVRNLSVVSRTASAAARAQVSAERAVVPAARATVTGTTVDRSRRSWASHDTYGYYRYGHVKSDHDKIFGAALIGFSGLLLYVFTSQEMRYDDRKVHEEFMKIRAKMETRFNQKEKQLLKDKLIYLSDAVFLWGKSEEFISLITMIKSENYSFPLSSALQDYNALLEQTLDIKKDFKTLERKFKIPHEIIVRESSYETILREIKLLKRAIKLIEESSEYQEEVRLKGKIDDVDLVDTPRSS